MKLPQTSLSLLLLALPQNAASNLLAKPEPCIVQANGYAHINDAPAIQTVIDTCGPSGGTILLPSNQNYSIQTPISFASCRNCDIQIEGRLFGSESLAYLRGPIFNLRGVQGAKIRSLTGTGFIDGNAYSYWLSRYDSGQVETDTFFDLGGASDIEISNLSIRDVKQRFFRATNASRILFSRLTLEIYDQWGEYPRNAVETAGIEIGNSTNIDIENINMTFRPRPGHRGPLGYCIPFDVGSTNIRVNDIICNGAVGGVVINLGSIRPYLAPQAVRNITMTNLVFDARVEAKTGFMNEWIGTLVSISDITWDNVTVTAPPSLQVFNCYQKIRGWTGYWDWCARNVQVNITNAVFKHFHGVVESEVPKVEVSNNMSFVDVRFEGWGMVGR